MFELLDWNAYWLNFTQVESAMKINTIVEMFEDTSSNIIFFNAIRPASCTRLQAWKRGTFQQKYAEDWLMSTEYYWIPGYLDIDFGWATGENDGTVYDRKLLGAVQKKKFIQYLLKLVYSLFWRSKS